MKKGLVTISLLLLMCSTPLLAEGVSSMPKRNPADEAAVAHSDGIRYRDRAWKAEKELATVQDPAKRKSLEESIRKSYDAAARAQRNAIRIDPTLVPAYSELGYALRKTGDYKKALEAYDTALQMKPNYAPAIEYRAEAYLGLNRVAEAREAYLMLWNGGDEKGAQTLGEAMQKWVGERKADPAGVPAATIEEMDKWLAQRKEIATHSGASGTKGGWR